MDVWTIITILIFASFTWPLIKNRLDLYKRLSIIKQIESERKSRVITMIHRQETLSLLGIQDAVLGSLDPIITSAGGSFYPAVSILSALSIPNRNRDDTTLILGDVAQKAMKQIKEIVYSLLLRHQSTKRASRMASFLVSGERTHDFPLTFENIKGLGLSVSDYLPKAVSQLMALYPQPSMKQQSVEFIPTPYFPQIPKRGKQM